MKGLLLLSVEFQLNFSSISVELSYISVEFQLISVKFQLNFCSTSSFLRFENWDQEVGLPRPVVFLPSSLGNLQKRKRVASDKLTLARPPAKLRNLEKRRARARARAPLFEFLTRTLCRK